MAMRMNRHLLVSLVLISCVGACLSFLGLSTNHHEGRIARAQFDTILLSAVDAFGSVLHVDDRKNDQRAIDLTTWQLLHGTNVGEWGRLQFEEAERIVEAWSQRQSKRAALVVERLLLRIVKEQMAENPYADCVDMTALYTNLIDGWSNCGELGGAERAEEILDYFQRIYEEGDSYDPLLCGPGLRSFNAVIGAYARSGREDAPQQAIRVLSKLYDLTRQGRTCVFPNKETYAHVLRAFAKKATADSPELVRKLLMHMENLSEVYPTLLPDFSCHNVYIYALAESMNHMSISGAEATKLAEEYLLKMLDSQDESVLPDKWTFNAVLSLLSRSGTPDLVPRAESVLARLEAYHIETGRSEKTQPNSNVYNSLMSCYTRGGNSDKAQKAFNLLQKMKKLGASGNPWTRPDTISYNIAMNAFAKSRRRDAPIKVEELLLEMNDEYAQTGDPRIRPNRRSVNTCLDAWAKSGLDGADERIMAWIQRMREAHESGQNNISPDMWSYTHYLQALSKAGKPRMGDEAERVLEEMEDLYRKGYQSLKPNVLTFTNAIHCIALSGQDDAVERALAILDRMEDLHAGGFGDVRPNLFTYNCVINTIAKSKRRGKAELALQILRRIQSVALRPGSVSFNNVINACAFSGHPNDDPGSILQIALEVLKEAQEGPGANWITYQSAIRVICSYEVDPGTCVALQLRAILCI
jgi:pentatricopeptide repeat protein